MGCCEKQAVETAVFCWASGPITWPQPGPVGTFLWTSSAVPVTFPLGSSPLPPCPLRCPESRRSRPHYAPPLVERSKGAGGPEWTRGQVAAGGERIRGSLTPDGLRPAISSQLRTGRNKGNPTV